MKEKEVGREAFVAEGKKKRQWVQVKTKRPGEETSDKGFFRLFQHNAAQSRWSPQSGFSGQKNGDAGEGIRKPLAGYRPKGVLGGKLPSPPSRTLAAPETQRKIWVAMQVITKSPIPRQERVGKKKKFSVTIQFVMDQLVWQKKS